MNQVSYMIAKTFASLTVVTVGHETVLEPMLNTATNILYGATNFISSLPLC